MNQFTQHYLQSMEKTGANWAKVVDGAKNLAAPLIGGTAGYAFNDHPGDPMAKWIGAASGATMGAIGRGASMNSTNKAVRIGVPAAAALAGDVMLPVGRQAMVASTGRNLAERDLAIAQTEALKRGPRSSAPAATPASTVNVTTPPAPDVTVNNNSPSFVEAMNNLSPATKTLLGIGAAGVAGAGIYSMVQAARANKRKADGLETPPVTNVNVAGGGGAGPGAPAAPGAPSTSAGTLRVTLPTRKVGDNESTVEMPLERIGLSNAILTKLRRDVKRRLRSESDSRTHRIIPAGPLAQGLN